MSFASSHPRKASKTASGSPTRLRRYLIGLAIAWTAIIGILLPWNLYLEWREVIDVARQGAAAAYEKDVVYRRWNSQHNGVYVEVNGDTVPNEYLKQVPERDIITPSGRVLTLVNPAYMTRQVHELGGSEHIISAHITSLNPLNPRNVPDPWEAKALKLLAAGKNEVFEPVMAHGRRYLRLMGPLLTEPSCVECHRAQGAKVGEMRGGISITIALAPYEAIARARMIPISLGYGALWLVGLAGISQGSRGLRQRIVAEVKMQQKQETCLRLAHEIQQRFYSTKASVPGFDIAGATVSATYTSGDYFDFIRQSDGSLLLVIGDVSGHGFGSALVMAETRAYLRSFAIDGLDTGSLLNAVNRALSADLDGTQFVTLLLVHLDPDNRRFQFAGAGHLPCFLLSCSGEVRCVLDSCGPPAGLFRESKFVSSEPISLEQGETLLLITDGITEAEDGGGIQFGTREVIEFVKSHPQSEAEELVRGICDVTRQFAGKESQQDDITCVVCRVDGGRQIRSHPCCASEPTFCSKA